MANNFNPKKETWTCPLDITVRQKRQILLQFLKKEIRRNYAITDRLA